MSHHSVYVVTRDAETTHVPAALVGLSLTLSAAAAWDRHNLNPDCDKENVLNSDEDDEDAHSRRAGLSTVTVPVPLLTGPDVALLIDVVRVVEENPRTPTTALHAHFSGPELLRALEHANVLAFDKAMVAVARAIVSALVGRSSDQMRRFLGEPDDLPSDARLAARRDARWVGAHVYVPELLR